MNIYLIKIKNQENLTFLKGFSYDLKQIINDLKNIPFEKTYSYELYKTNDLKELPSVYSINISRNLENSSWWNGTYTSTTNYYYDIFTKILESKKVKKLTGFIKTSEIKS